MLRRCRPSLGTFVEIAVEEGDEAAIEAAFAAVAHVQARMSFHEETSDLARLRAADPGKVVRVSRITVEVLRLAATLHAASRGLFDVTVGRRLSQTGFLPRVEASDRFVGRASDIEVVDDRHVRCRRAVLIDLGGIAKGYAVDRAVAALQAAKISGGIVNAGGDLRVFGPNEATVHLRSGGGLIAGTLSVADCAVASSANLLQRRFSRGRVCTPHVRPGGRSVLIDQTVTVVAPTCVLADAMTKVAMLDRSLAQSILGQGGVVIEDQRRDAA